MLFSIQFLKNWLHTLALSISIIRFLVERKRRKLENEVSGFRGKNEDLEDNNEQAHLF